jgi:Amt family ammonium transporter
MNGVWNAQAWIPSIDFAGGTVVHMSSGISALVLCWLLGPRIGFKKEPMPPHSMVLCMVGTGMLWTGWYGFNAGSALAADGVAANAFMTTTLAAAVGSFVWAACEFFVKGKSSVLGYCSGAVAGLVVITPAAGFVDATSAVIMGVAAGVVPFVFCTSIKEAIGYDDSLDTFGIHGVGGTLGALLTGVFASPEINGFLIAGASETNKLKEAVLGGTLWWEQLKAIGITAVLSVVMTTIIAVAIRSVIGLRPAPDDERQGLDITDHGEEGYVM